MGFFSNLSSDMLGTAKKTAAESGVDVVTLANTEQGGIDVQKRDLGNGVNAYLDENGQISSFSRVDPARPGMIQLYGPNGESRGEERITTTTQDLIKNLGPIALAAGGTALVQSLLGPAAGAAGSAAGTAGMTAAELAQLDLSLGGAGGTLGAETLANSLATGAAVPTLTNLTGGSGVLTGAAAGITAESVAAKLAADAAANGTVNALIPPVVPGGGIPPVVPIVPPGGVIPPVVPTNLSSLLTPAAIAASALVGADASKTAAATQADAATQANALLYKMYQEQKGLQEPFRGAGITAQNRLLDLLGLSQNKGAEGFGKYGRDFSMSDFTADPGYAFRLAEGQKTLERNAAARGGLISGGALKAATRYGQDMGSQEYQSAFNRYQTNRANQLNPLGSLLTSGQAAASNQATAAGNYGTQAGGNITGAGAATAAGQVGSTNALTNALSSYLNYSSGQNLADAIRKSTYGG
jgi:hypothetical protein